MAAGVVEGIVLTAKEEGGVLVAVAVDDGDLVVWVIYSRIGIRCVIVCSLLSVEVVDVGGLVAPNPLTPLFLPLSHIIPIHPLSLLHPSPITPTLTPLEPILIHIQIGYNRGVVLSHDPRLHVLELVGDGVECCGCVVVVWFGWDCCGGGLLQFGAGGTGSGGLVGVSWGHWGW